MNNFFNFPNEQYKNRSLASSFYKWTEGESNPKSGMANPLPAQPDSAHSVHSGSIAETIKIERAPFRELLGIG